MSRSCVWPGCKLFAPNSICCDEHWKHVRVDIRQRLGGTFDMFEETPAFRKAVAMLHAWVQATFAADVRDNRDPGKWERLVRFVRQRDEARRARHQAVEPDPAPPARDET